MILCFSFSQVLFFKSNGNNFKFRREAFRLKEASSSNYFHINTKSFQLMIIIDPQETNYKQISEAGTIFVKQTEI